MYLVKWRLFNNCNFRCSYCIQGIDKTYEEINVNRLHNFSKKINKLIEKNNDIVKLNLLGGEITLIPINEFLIMLDELLNPLIQGLTIISNFSAPLDWYKKTAQLCEKKNVKFSLNLSFHEEFFDYDKFISKAISLKNDVRRMCIEFVCTYDNLEIRDRLLKDCKEAGIRCALDYNRHQNWSKEEIIESERSFYIATIKTAGCICSNSYTMLNILPSGRMYGVNCPQKKFIGTLNLSDSIKKETIICEQPKCSFCGFLKITTKDGSVIYDNTNKEKKIKSQTEGIKGIK